MSGRLPEDFCAFRGILKREMERGTKGCGGNVEWKYGENRRGIGRNVKKSHSGEGKARYQFSQSHKNGEMDVLPMPAKRSQAGSVRIRGTVRHRKRARREEPGKTQTVRNFRTVQKNKGSNQSGSRRTEETERKVIQNGRNRTNASMFSFSGSGRTVRGKEKAPCRRAWRKAGYGA